MAQKNTETAFTEQKYQEITNNVLGVLDTTFTLAFRYPQLVEHDFLSHHDTNGPGLDYTSTHPVAAIVVNGVIVAFGCLRLAYDIKNVNNLKRARPASSFKKSPAPAVNKPSLWEKIKTHADNFWNRLSFASFTYWILWVGSTLFIPSGAGLAAVPLWITFGLPLMVGFGLFPILKKLLSSRRQLSNNPTPDLNYIIEERFTEVTNKNLTKETSTTQNSAKKLDKSSFQTKYERLTKNKYARLAATFVFNWVNFFAASQYAGWILSDLFMSVTGMSVAMPAIITVFAIIFLASTAFAIHRTALKNKEIEAIAATNIGDVDLEKENQVRKLREQYKEHAKYVPHYNKNEFFNNVDSDNFAIKARGKYPRLRHAWNFINGFMNGIFMARVFLVPSTVLFMPFALAALSGPAAIAILAAFGIGWGIFRTFHQHNMYKEQKAKEFLEYKDERKTILNKEHEYYTSIISQLSGEKSEPPYGRRNESTNLGQNCKETNNFK